MMFLEHFGLVEQPFGVTPDPRFLRLGPTHREALASLLYATENNRGFLALIAPPGMGKTSLLFHYLESMRNQARTAFLFHAPGDSRDLMRYLLADLGIKSSGVDLPGMHEALHQVLTEEMRAGRRLILVIDEAQNLNERVLESIRVLSNFETPWMKLVQIVLSGQPQLAEHLARPSMSQLRQRISSLIRLEPFNAEETHSYITHRLWVAGYSGPSLFTVGAHSLVAKHSGGIPRNINNLCFHSMALASATAGKQVNSQVVSEAIEDLSIDFCTVQPALAGTSFDGPSVVPFCSPSAHKKTNLAQVAAPPGNVGRLIAVIVVLCAGLTLSLAPGAPRKTGAGNSPVAAPPTAKAAPFPAAMTTIEPAPETLPSHGAMTRSNAATSKKPYESVSVGQAAPNRPVIAVKVETGITLRHLCLLHLDRFDRPTLSAILLLNPAIVDPNYIEAGQRIRLPWYLRRDGPKGPSVDAGIAAISRMSESPREEQR